MKYKLKPYIIYAQIGFSTNRQTFNKNIAGGKIPDFYVAQIIIQNRRYSQLKKINSEKL